MKWWIICLIGCLMTFSHAWAVDTACTVQALHANFPEGADYIRIPKGQIVENIDDFITIKSTKHEEICQRRGFCFPYRLTVWDGPTKTRTPHVPAYRFLNCVIGKRVYHDKTLVIYTFDKIPETYGIHSLPFKRYLMH
ncbi:hypothetical protein COMNV_00860 [Commensalibacter sp. Nvir]|uniref:hypothetical protein n=1 Tax=Commensalibacter sp. Nvir TaxID=3069817 RepID=UPI002D3EB054|nr:hypothetical protein COMNV_00860 [Commensalibacter sp. Nvir]